MSKNTLLPLLLAAATVVNLGCTTVSSQTSVVSQAAAAGAGQDVRVGASARAPSPPIGELVPIEKWIVTLVTAKSVPRLGEVREIADTFTFEGRIYAHATLTSQPGVHGGQPSVEIRWFNGERLVSVQKAQPVVNKSPYYMVSSTSGTALGIGQGRVEFSANGKLIATKAFVVSEK